MFLQEFLPWGRAPLEPFALGVGMGMRDAMRDALRDAMRFANFSRLCSFLPETGTVSLLGLGALFRIRLLDADHTCSGVWSWAVHRLCMLSGVFFELRPFAIFFEFLNGPTPPFSYGSSPLFWCPRVFLCRGIFGWCLVGRDPRPSCVCAVVVECPDTFGLICSYHQSAQREVVNTAGRDT